MHWNASGKDIGGVLSQVQRDGLKHPSSFGSRTLSKSERNYSTTRQEMLALKFFLEHFPGITCVADLSLKWLDSFKEPTGQITRWLEVLAQFDMKITHRPGKRHGNADAMSRQPIVDEIAIIRAIQLDAENARRWASE